MVDEATFLNHWTDSDKQEVMELNGPILVVGASGFIGANLYFNLAGAGRMCMRLLSMCKTVGDFEWTVVRCPPPGHLASGRNRS